MQLYYTSYFILYNYVAKMLLYRRVVACKMLQNGDWFDFAAHYMQQKFDAIFVSLRKNAVMSNLPCACNATDYIVRTYLLKVNNRNSRTRCEMFKVHNKDSRTTPMVYL